ncbi:MAG: DPP IV N-terminal domain-containing protein, partial [Planctomycetota bacterium]|nr:DPP IV N-terminal domain-containing protein [Planctomycetota bacterium]
MTTKSIITGIFIVLLLSATSYAAGESPSESDAGYLNLERIIDSDEFNSKSYGPIRWLEDGSGYTTLEDAQAAEEDENSKNGKSRDIVRYDPASGEREIMVSSELLRPSADANSLKIDDYSWSQDGKKLLIFTNTKRVWRRNTRGDYWVLDLVTSKLQKLGGDVEPFTLMFAKFSPNGKRVAYVRQKNLYVQNIKDLRITQLTEDGSENLINGTSDWVYEEEFSLRDGFRWSPNGKSIAYWQFNTEGVRDFHLINYTDALYPKITSFEYPKVGEMNSACRVGVISSRGGKTRWFEPSYDPRNHYIPKMDWAENSKQIVFQHLNRLQNTNEITLGNVRKGKLRKIMTERDDAWLDVRDKLNLYWLDGGKHFTWLSERDGWRHLYLVSRSGRKVKLLTPGEFDVIEMVSIDE